MSIRTPLALLAVIVAALGLVACGGNGDDDASQSPAPAQTGTTGGMSDGMSEIAAASPAADLRVALDTLLGERAARNRGHTEGSRRRQDFEAAAAALDANSVELSEAIGSVYGDEAAKQFLDGPSLWRDHIGFFVDYTVGVAKKDTAAQREAVDNLTGYSGAFSGSSPARPACRRTRCRTGSRCTSGSSRASSTPTPRRTTTRPTGWLVRPSRT